MEEYTPEQILAIEEFHKDLKECYANKLKGADEFTRILMNYAIQVLDIHLSLAQIKFDRYSNNMAREFEGQVK